MPTRNLSTANKPEVTAYFDLWVKGGDSIIERFRTELSSGGGPYEALDGTPAGLEPLMEWVVNQVEFVAAVDEHAELPAWYVAGPATDPSVGEMSPDSAHLVDGLCRYYAEVLIRNLPGVRWEIGDEPRRRKQYVDQNWPLVVGPLIAINPVRVAAIVAREARKSSDVRDSGWLLANYQRYAEILASEESDNSQLGWWVDEIDDVRLRDAGWRWEIGLDDEWAARPEPVHNALTTKLESLAGSSQVEQVERDAWWVAGTLEQQVIEAAVRAWTLEHSI